jgi:hypothetical protein
MDKLQRAELLDEYYKLAGFVQVYDSYSVSIKAWGVTVSGAALGLGFSKDVVAHNAQIALFFIALLLAVAFWATDTEFKLLQQAHIYRYSALEKALQQDESITSPSILKTFCEGVKRDDTAHRWRSVAFWPSVMLPHVFFVGLSLLAIVLRGLR